MLIVDPHHRHDRTCQVEPKAWRLRAREPVPTQSLATVPSGGFGSRTARRPAAPGRGETAGAGEGIAPVDASWVTLALKPGRYELVCNLPGHYAAGMYGELDVT
jgi:hypothetical protein